MGALAPYTIFMDITHYVIRLQDFYRKERRMPSSREFADRIIKTKSKRQAETFISLLVNEGIIGKDYSGRLVPTSYIMGIRELGTVEAGFPSMAEEELADTVTLDEWLITDQLSTYMLKVSGQSMIDAGIQPGDTALVERGRQPKKGDIVIACVDGKWTIKYYQIENNKVVLVPANKRFPKIYPNEELRIEAVVTAIIRKY